MTALTLDDKVHYHRLKSGGYQLTQDLHFASPLLAGCAARVEGFVELDQHGSGVLRAGYWSDGMSGPLGESCGFHQYSPGLSGPDGLPVGVPWVWKDGRSIACAEASMATETARLAMNFMR